LQSADLEGMGLFYTCFFGVFRASFIGILYQFNFFWFKKKSLKID